MQPTLAFWTRLKTALDSAVRTLLRTSECLLLLRIAENFIFPTRRPWRSGKKESTVSSWDMFLFHPPVQEWEEQAQDGFSIIASQGLAAGTEWHSCLPGS